MLHELDCNQAQLSTKTFEDKDICLHCYGMHWQGDHISKLTISYHTNEYDVMQHTPCSITTPFREDCRRTFAPSGSSIWPLHSVTLAGMTMSFSSGGRSPDTRLPQRSSSRGVCLFLASSSAVFKLEMLKEGSNAWRSCARPSCRHQAMDRECGPFSLRK